VTGVDVAALLVRSGLTWIVWPIFSAGLENFLTAYRDVFAVASLEYGDDPTAL
jgi:hypothetical protein